jgi:hypothetical protein
MRANCSAMRRSSAADVSHVCCPVHPYALRVLQWRTSPPQRLLAPSHRTIPLRALSSPAIASSASLATIDRRLWCSSGPVDPASSVARALRCSPTSPTEPTTAGQPPQQRTPPTDHHRRHDRAPMSLPPPFAPNQDHRRPSLLPGRFPADQRLPVGRIWPVSHRRRGGFVSPVSSAVGRNAQGGWAAWPSRPSPAVG